MKPAIDYSGDMQIELVEAVGANPCAFFDIIDEGRIGLHHACYSTNGIEKDLIHQQN